MGSGATTWGRGRPHGVAPTRTSRFAVSTLIVEMKQKLQRQYRRSTRLPGRDYSQPGAYFVTIVTQDRAPLFGQIVNGEMYPSAAGRMVLRWFYELEHRYPCLKCDAVVCMPDHIHFVIFIMDSTRQRNRVGATLCGRPAVDSLDQHPPCLGDQYPPWLGDHIGSPLPSLPDLGDIVGWFKTMTTNEYIRGVKHHGWPSFNGRLWQRNYYDHIVRTHESLSRIRRYIIDNPRRGDPKWSPES